MQQPLLSIIIPTFNRKEILRRTLHSIEHQKNISLDTVEVIVVDDGSTDGTGEMVAGLSKWSFSFHYLIQKNQGQGNARNNGLSEAHGQLVLFIGDDILLTPYFLAEHIKVHQKYPADNITSLGYTTWHPELRVTSFMYFLEHGGPQFNYSKLAKRTVIDEELQLRRADYWFFYTSNICLKRSLIGEDRFESLYTGYGWEDIDFGYHLTKEKGMEVLYNAQAIGLHYHEITQDSFQKRMISVGQNALLFHQRYPETGVLPKGLKKLLFRVLASAPVIGLLHLFSGAARVQQWYFYALSKRYFFLGLKRV